MSRRTAVRTLARGVRRTPVRSAKCLAWFVVSSAAEAVAVGATRVESGATHLDLYAWHRARALDFRPDEV